MRGLISGLVIILGSWTSLSAQLLSEFDIAAENFEYRIKNIETLISRFNHEVDQKGIPIDTIPNQAQAILELARIRAILALFDYQYIRNCELEEQEVIRSFVQTVVKNDWYLDFYDKDWFAQINYKVKYKGKEEQLMIELVNYSPKPGMSAWTISSINFDAGQFIFETKSHNILLPPNSHGTKFINLKQMLQNHQVKESNIEEHPDLKTFISLIDKKELRLQHIENIIFQFRQFEPYIFKVDYYNRNTSNSGWLISDVTIE